MTADILIGMLAEPVRMRVFAAVVLGAGTPQEVAQRAGATPRQTAASLRRLTEGGLVATVDGALVARIDAFKDVARGRPSRPSEPLDPDDNRAAVLRAFIKVTSGDVAGLHNDTSGDVAGLHNDTSGDVAGLHKVTSGGQLVSIPAAQGKRRVVLEHIAAGFEPGVRYPEKEVNAVLRQWHPDFAALRRYLIDESLLARDAGVYWRVGGPVL